jgi:hypothetical protein
MAVLGHLGAFLLAIAALFCAGGHVLIVWEFLTGCGALFTALGTAFKHVF